MVYTLLIHDDRYSAPSLYLLTIDNDGDAIATAQARLAESHHHHGVELWDGDRLVLKEGQDKEQSSNIALQSLAKGERAE
jgi:hypothetical protein